MRQEKKKYLNQYLLQETKINRMKQMARQNPGKRKELEKTIKEAEGLRESIELSIKNVDGGILSEVLFQKYIFGKTLEEISLILNYSKRHIERLHIKALEKFKM